MDIQELQKLYATLPQVAALAQTLDNNREKTVALSGLAASSAPMVFSALALKSVKPILFILPDADEAGYFYHDLCQVMGDKDVLFFPSSYRRAIKYGQKDPANEILRTEALTRLNSPSAVQGKSLYVVSHPEAIAEQVVTRKSLDDRMLTLSVGETVGVEGVCQTLGDFGFREVDYVYEPGQFALRGSILDVFSFSCEYPFRVDFFGDDIDSIRTFDVENQLSRERRDHIDIVPELTMAEDKDSLFRFLPADTVLAAKDFAFVRDSVERAWQEGGVPDAPGDAPRQPDYQRRTVRQRQRGLP